MYEKFFGLDELPFRLTPDPRYLFLSEKHREALAHLVFGIRESAGFIAVTGEIGAGKTTLLRALLRDSTEEIQYAYILNPVLSGVELLQEINHELGIPIADSRRELLANLNRYLLAQKARDLRVVVVVDEAQALDGAILEQLRLLSNFETESAKLLQIVLVGQPELREMLGRPSLAQLNQRITVRWHLGALDRRETVQYIAHRIATAAGGHAKALFNPSAIARIYRYSKGVPRLINIACHRALLVAFTSEATAVNGTIARQAIRELRLHEPVRRVPLRWAWAASALAAVAAVAVTATALTMGWSPFAVREPAQGALAWRAESHSESSSRPVEAITAPAGSVEPAPEDPPRDGSPSGTRAATRDSAADIAAGSAAQAEGGARATPGGSVDGSAIASVPQATGAGPIAAAGEPLPRDASTGAGGAGPPPGAPGETSGAELSVERATFADALRQVTPGNSAYEATQALLRTWSVKPLTAREAASPALDLPTIARARGLEYLSLYGNLNLLRVLDLPAILEVTPEDGSAARFVTVAQLDENRANVMVGGTAADISPPVLAETWFGRAHIFWRDFDHLGPVLALGSTSVAVRRLHELLRASGAYDGVGSARFAPETEQAVLQFQRSRRLFADGKVGPMTMIALYQKVAADRLPRLAGAPAAAERGEPGLNRPLGGQG